jgi:hypothetical protein
VTSLSFLPEYEEWGRTQFEAPAALADKERRAARRKDR